MKRLDANTQNSSNRTMRRPTENLIVTRIDQIYKNQPIYTLNSNSHFELDSVCKVTLCCFLLFSSFPMKFFVYVAYILAAKIEFALKNTQQRIPS